MYLCDIGNTNATLNHNGKVWSIPVDRFQFFDTKEKLFYINVNPNLKEVLKGRKNFINLEEYFEFDTIYKGIGIDRVAACYSIKDGVIVDAGSAIKFDIMSNSIHLGGFILPGIGSLKKAYKNISSILDVDINLNVNFDTMPQNTVDAVSYGLLRPIVLIIKENCKRKKIYFTGGDGEILSKFFPDSIYVKDLIFLGMREVLEQKNLIN